MQRHERPIHAFRRRLLRLIDEQYDGRYTILARRAGVPITTMQHYIHTAKRLPGGEHLMRLAAALGVTVEQLVSGPAGVRPAARPVPRIPVPPAGRRPPGPDGPHDSRVPVRLPGRVSAHGGRAAGDARRSRRCAFRRRCSPRTGTIA